MLNHLVIRDFAIVERLELDFSPGMTALTGETGAGKSILLDALGLTLGDRAAADSIRAGADKAEVAVAFDISAMEGVHQWLLDHDLDEGGECQLRRVIQGNGRSRGYVNGRPVPLQLLRELGEQLVDIHGQHEHQSLMKREIQRNIVDAYAGNEEILGQLAGLHARTVEIEQTMQRLAGEHGSSVERHDLLSYQLQELETLDLEPEAISALDEEHRRLSNAGELLQATRMLLGLLYEDETSAQGMLGHARRTLEEHADKDAVFAEVAELINQALLQLDEGVDVLRRHVDALELDPARLEEVEARLGNLNDLARKHRVRPEELTNIRDGLRRELDEIDNSEEKSRFLELELQQIRDRYMELAGDLRERRQHAAAELDEEVTGFLQELGMQGAAFRVAVEPVTGDQLKAHGLDRISFLVRTNAGQGFGPLQRIASGGELSRISLAIQAVAANSTSIPTLIFDEADAGISGGVAEVVGRLLRRLGTSHQVLCVTHLPQVASQAHRHLQVRKHSERNHTATSVVPLVDDSRIQEIARMLGGMEITDATLTHAQEMVARAGDA